MEWVGHLFFDPVVDKRLKALDIRLQRTVVALRIRGRGNSVADARSRSATRVDPALIRLRTIHSSVQGFRNIVFFRGLCGFTDALMTACGCGPTTEAKLAAGGQTWTLPERTHGHCPMDTGRSGVDPSPDRSLLVMWFQNMARANMVLDGGYGPFTATAVILGSGTWSEGTWAVHCDGGYPQPVSEHGPALMWFHGSAYHGGHPRPACEDGDHTRGEVGRAPSSRELMDAPPHGNGGVGRGKPTCGPPCGVAGEALRLSSAQKWRKLYSQLKCLGPTPEFGRNARLFGAHADGCEFEIFKSSHTEWLVLKVKSFA